MSKVISSNLHVSEDVMAMIAGIAATSVDGVKNISGDLTKNKIPFVDKNSLKKGVSVESDGSDLKVTISLVLKNEGSIHDTCLKVQEKVKETLEGMMDANVNDVEIRVENIVEEKNEK